MNRKFLYATGGESEGAKGTTRKRKTVSGELTGQATDKQIAEWKEKYKAGIYCIEVGGHIAYFHNPSRRQMNCALSKADKDAALDMFQELAELTFIGGSEEPLNDDTMFYGLIQQLREKMDGAKAELKNL